METPMASALARLRRRSEFLAVAAAGRKSAAPGLVLQARGRGDADPPRLGFTATRKLGGAVERNRARRRLKEAARLLAPALARAGHDYVLVARAGTLTRPWSALLADLERAFART
jgi:ribonuclease P protein component